MGKRGPQPKTAPAPPPRPAAKGKEVRVWWKAKESKWPMLAKMVKQYLAAPASSAGVERVFSAAGKMHGDLQKSSKDSTLEHTVCGVGLRMWVLIGC